MLRNPRLPRGLCLVRITPIDLDTVSAEELARIDVSETTGIELYEQSESFSYTNDVGQRPIEDGADVTDHIALSPISVTVNFTVGKNAKFVNDLLHIFRDSRGIFRYEGIDRSLENVAITRLEIPRNSDILDGFSGTINLQQVWIIPREDEQEGLPGEDEDGSLVQEEPESAAERQPGEDVENQDDEYLSAQIGGL